MDHYYLLAILDDSSQVRLAELSDNLTEQGFDYKRFTPYHITLWNGDKPSEEFINHIEETCKSFEAISTSLGSVGLFGLAVIFFAPLPSKELIAIEEKICGTINDEPVGWVPHVTLRMGEPEYIKNIAPIIAELFEPFRIRIERVELYACGEDYANLVRTFTLKNG